MYGQPVIKTVTAMSQNTKCALIRTQAVSLS